MANPYRGQVEIDLGNETRVLKLDLNGIAELETRLDKSVSQIFQSAGIVAISETLHIALISGNRHRGITVKQVRTWMGDGTHNLEYYGTAVSDLLGIALRTEGDEEDENPLEDKPEPGVKLASG